MSCSTKLLFSHKFSNPVFHNNTEIYNLRQTRKNCCGNTVFYQCFVMFSSAVGKLRRIACTCLIGKKLFRAKNSRPSIKTKVLRSKCFEYVRNIFASWEANFVFATMFPYEQKGNIYREHNVYQSLPLDISSGSTIYILIQNHRQSKNELETKFKALMTSIIRSDI